MNMIRSRVLRILERANARGAVMVEFAILAPILFGLNFTVYEIATRYELRERSKYSGQIIHKILSNDRDHAISFADLNRMVLYRNNMLGQLDGSIDTALVIIDAMPVYFKDSSAWQFVVCWSWSSNPLFVRAPFKGTILPSGRYPVGPWAPSSGTSANFASLIVEVHERIGQRLGIPAPLQRLSHKIEGPISYAPTLPINLILSDYPGGTVLNDNSRTDPNSGNAILCRR